ncbi:MAG: hypothetical protein HDT43_06775 [Ruminococcaceae bacterium]|nr:hypothetical protein [Oscillospiraceae bacterium]
MTCYPINDPNFGTITFEGNWIGWVFLGVVILALAVPVVMHFYKGVVREIVIVKKRETVRDLFNPESNPNSSYVEMRMTSVDYRIKGKKMLHTKFCADELMDELTVGETYKVHIHLNYITEIIQ